MSETKNLGVQKAASLLFTFLLYTINLVLGQGFFPIISSSMIHPEYVIEHACYHVKRLSIPSMLVDLRELDDYRFQQNSSLRCYICKTKLFERAFYLAKRYDCLYVVDGTNADDSLDDRPGYKANEEWGVRSLLREGKLGKGDIKILSDILGFPYNVMYNESCLAARFPAGVKIDAGRIRKISHVENIFRSEGVISPRVFFDDNDVVYYKVKSVDAPLLSCKRIQERLKRLIKDLGFKALIFQCL